MFSRNPARGAQGKTQSLLEPPAPSEGIQYRMTAEIPPGQESYGCRLFVAPEEGLFINREEVRFSAGGHHVLLYRTPYTEIPSQNERGEAVDAESIHDCSEGATALWKISGVLGGSESFGGRGLLDELPEGVAVAIEPGAVLLMSTHYLNATPEPIEVDSRINLYAIPREDVKVEAGVLYFDNPIIRVPANGTSAARMRCPITRDISIVGLQSHMHARGTAFQALLYGAEGGPKELYSTTEWKEPPVVDFSPTFDVHAGQAIDYRCDYASAEPHDVVRGETADDEMCQLIGPYFPRDRHLEACEDKDGELAATWYGSGAATCAQTLECLRKASPIEEDKGRDAWGCIVESRASDGEEVSALLRCRLTQKVEACSSTCKSPTSKGACEACLDAACADEVKACVSTFDADVEPADLPEEELWEE